MSQDDQDPASGSRLRRGVARAERLGRRLLGRRRRDKPVPEGPVLVRFEGSAEGEVPGGISLLAAAMRLDVDLSHYCGGMCSCGTCRVQLVEGADNLSHPQGNEQMVIGAERASAGDRLACQARILGPVVVRIPDWF